MKTNEQGSAILMVLLVIVSVTIMGLSALNITGYENNITGNYKRHEMTFNLTDGSIFSVAKMVSQAVQENKMPATVITHGLLDSGQSDTLFSQLAGFPSTDPAVDISFKYGTQTTDNVNIPVDVDVTVDINRQGAKSMLGSAAAEFAMGGGGGGFMPDTAIVYVIDAVGSGPAQSKSDIDAVYYKVLGPKTGL